MQHYQHWMRYMQRDTEYIYCPPRYHDLMHKKSESCVSLGSWLECESANWATVYSMSLMSFLMEERTLILFQFCIVMVST